MALSMDTSLPLSAVVQARSSLSADAAPRLAEMAGTGDLVFAKGSRGIAMELALPEAAR